MKNFIFDVKKATGKIHKKGLSLVLASFVTSGVFAGGIPVIDLSSIANQVKDYTMQLEQYKRLYDQLQQQIQMVKMQELNLQSLGEYNWEELSSVLQETKKVMSQNNALSYDTGGVSQRFEDIYKDFDSYSSDLRGASNENERTKLYSQRRKKITQTTQNTLNATLQKLELQYKDLKDSDKVVSKLKQRSQNAQGNLQVMQAANDLLAYQIDEIRKLRTTIMDQSNMLANYLAAQNNERIMRQAKFEKFLENAGKAGSSWGKPNPNALKWK